MDDLNLPGAGDPGRAVENLRRRLEAAEAEAMAAREAAARAAAREAARAAADAARKPVLPPLTPYEFQKFADFARKIEDENGRLALRIRAMTLALEAADAAHTLEAGGALAQNLAALRAEHELVLRSTTWRVGRRLGAVASRHPALARRLRRTAKFGWWVASGRIGARLRARQRMRHAIAVLGASRLFDAAYYTARHAGVVPPGTDALMHYLWVGAASGLDPHPLFDTSWYASQMPAGSPVNPLVHYLARTGTIDPHPLFDQAHYLAQAGAALQPGETALEHYLASADANTIAPNAVFDPHAYLVEYPDAASHPGGPLLHYVELGEARALPPHPLFDPAYYLAAHPEAAALGPFGHYLRVGRAAGHAGSATMAELGVPALPHDTAFAPADQPDISVIIPTYGHLFETIRCLAAVQARTGPLATEVIVADDRPHAPIASALPSGGGLAVHVNDRNLGFLRSCNAAAKRARGRLLVFLNNDTIVGPDWLRPMIAAIAADDRVGMVGCKLLNPDGTIQEAGGIIHSNGWGFPYGSGDDPGRGAYNAVRDVDVVTGACFVVRRDLFERFGGFDDRYAPAFYEEFDLATTLREAGYRVVYQPASVVVHHGSASYGREVRDRQSKRNHAKFCAKWRTLLARQPVEGDPLFLVRGRPSPRGVILVIDDKVPEYDKHAGAVTLFQYLCLCVELGLKVIFHPQDGQPLQPYTDVLQQRGIEVVHAPDTLAEWLAENGRHVDFVWTARPYVTVPILDLIKRSTGAPILYYTHDLHYLREMRRYELDGNAWAREESERLKPMELGIFAAVDIVMTPSTEEARIIAAEVPDARVAVVPPYLFADAAATDPATLDFTARRDVLFVGGFDHTPNVDAALWLVRDIMPLVWARAPDTRAMIVGHAPPAEVRALAGDRVEVTGFVPSIDPYFARARASVSPLRYGAGVKGKIVSALQAGVPVVTTGCGNEGIQLRHGAEALIGENEQEIATAILRLLDDAALCSAMSQAGAAVVRERFSATRARHVLRGLLGDDLCPVCGTRPRHPQPATAAEWGEAIACMTCLARNRGAEIARAMLTPFHRYGVSSLREARPRLADLRIHAVGSADAVARELAALPGFTCADAPDIADVTVDLLIGLAAPVDAAAAHRVLRPGGRYIFATPTASDPLPDQLRARGFSVTASAEAGASLTVFEATRRG